ncbi:GTP cyclohydrolase II [Nannocystis exedens]|nr:GTP cyclohydrolase II [Nannocystis exedens]
MPMANNLQIRPLRAGRGAQVFSQARLPSRHGELQIVSFIDDAGRTLDDVAIVRGDVRGRAEVPTRLHSECLTGDVFGSYRCDCRDQLELALQRIARGEAGIILYLRQEGRGIGIAQKVRAYHLQERGLDTVEANLHMGFDDDLRDYSVAAAMLRALEVGSVVLHTNNLRKVAGLQQGGVDVVCREPLIAEVREQNRRYLATKRDKSGHLL